MIHNDHFDPLSFVTICINLPLAEVETLMNENDKKRTWEHIKQQTYGDVWSVT